MLHTSTPSLQSPAMWAGLSLFESLAPSLVSGVYYQDDFITEAQEAALIEACDRGVWNHDYRRRVCFFGRGYQRDEKAPPMPDALVALGQGMVRDGLLRSMPQTAHINEYLPGQGIGAHRDIDSEAIEVVAIVSLNSGAVMNFSRLGREDVPYYLHRRSLLTMQGEALQRWMHAIPARKSDSQGGLLVPRGRRLSVVFRA